jgi:capsular polysaccharide export protein
VSLRGDGRHFLFLRGPFGPFFHQFADALRATGARVSKVNLDVGDAAIWGPFRPASFFADPIEAFGPWVAKLIVDEGVTDLVCFNDRMSPHEDAIAEARRLGIAIHVLEEGYYRPHWVTLDRGGVNVNSSLPRDPDSYRAAPEGLHEPPQPEQAGFVTRGLVYATIWHYGAKMALAPFYKRRASQFPLDTFGQMIGYSVTYLKGLAGWKGWPPVEAKLLAETTPFFLVLVQKSGDTQLTHNSAYDNPGFVRAVLESFAKDGPPDAILAFKLHPLEPSMKATAQLVLDSARDAGLADRVVVLDGGNLNALARKSVGAVTVNSTAGLAAIGFLCPVKVLGQAFYDLPGLTDQRDLADFWRDPAAPDGDLVKRFRRVVLARTQINGSFFTPKGRRMVIREACRRLLAPQTSGDPPSSEDSPA